MSAVVEGNSGSPSKNLTIQVVEGLLSFHPQSERRPTLCHEPLVDARVLLLLPRIDDDLALRVREAGCPQCGGRLDAADYPRKARAGACELTDEYERRRSFCCAAEGCRRRATPPSVRFLGRKVYLGAVAILGAAMQHGPTKKRVAELAVVLGINRRTLVRWRRWWSSTFTASRFWNDLRGRFAPAVDETTIPASLVSRFAPSDEPVVVTLLRVLAPISTRPWLGASAA